MTVCQAGCLGGRLLQVASERSGAEGEMEVVFAESSGLIQADLRIGAAVATAHRLAANFHLTNTGYILGGRGFVLSGAEATALAREPGAGPLLALLYNGSDIVKRSRGLSVIDCQGLDQQQLRLTSPAVWQWLRDRVFPERQVNPDPRVRERWWQFDVAMSNFEKRPLGCVDSSSHQKPPSIEPSHFSTVQASLSTSSLSRPRPTHCCWVCSAAPFMWTGHCLQAVGLAWATTRCTASQPASKPSPSPPMTPA